MTPGTLISGSAHVAVIGWVLLGFGFDAEPLPFEATNVSVISPGALNEMIDQSQPDAVVEAAQPAIPEPAEAPEVAAPEDTQPDTQTSQPVPAPAPEDAPDVSEIVVIPETDVADVAPDAPIAPPAAPAPVVDDIETPRPEQADRIAPTPVAPPEPDVAIAEVPQAAVSPSDQGDSVQEEQDAAQQEEASTEIVTEAEEVGTITRSPRPIMRPAARPQQTAQPSPEPEVDSATPTEDEAVAAAVAAVAGDTETSEPTGPPLTSGERDSLKLAVGNCWNVGSLSSDALQTIVTVGFEMQRDGKPVQSSIRLVGATGGSGSSVEQAYEAARRAILICGARGFSLPSEKFAQWKDIEITFNPSEMGLR